MAFYADSINDSEIFDYLTGDEYQGMSIVVDRFYFLEGLNEQKKLKIALRDNVSGEWTKHRYFPDMLINFNKSIYGSSSYMLSTAIDIHRSIMPNEVVIEADYKTYQENYEAAQIIGKIIEEKGFSPMYYFSGNKSVHIHVFFDWKCLSESDDLIREQLRTRFDEDLSKFKKYFIKFLREKMISCWDTGARKFDTDMINSTHLIRSEMSRNKLGYKTFIGYSYKDISFIPYNCNEENRIYPKIGKIKLSSPHCINELLEEFNEKMKKDSKKRVKDYNLDSWTSQNKELRACVKFIYNEDFKRFGDGFKRGMFILLNELRKTFGDETARKMMSEWNEKMGNPIEQREIDFRFRSKLYSLSCDYIHKFLSEFGVTFEKKCNGNLYKTK